MSETDDTKTWNGMQQPYDSGRKAHLFFFGRDRTAREALSGFAARKGVRFEARAECDVVALEHDVSAPGCLVLEADPPAPTELALLEGLASRGSPLARIVLSARVSVPFVVRAMKSGVYDVIEKPTPADDLVRAVRAALDQAAHDFERWRRQLEFERRLSQLTERQREILHHIVLGKANKAIAYDLGISERTVEVHRYRLLRRMCVGSAVELARLAGAFRVAAGQEAAA
jgi:two-component system response regulator FixJ